MRCWWTSGALLVLACDGAEAPEVPASPPDRAELVGTWVLTVESHRHTAKRYGLPANELSLTLAEDGGARWVDVPGPVWGGAAADVLARSAGTGSWTLDAGPPPRVLVRVAGGATRTVVVLGSTAPWTLALEEPVAEGKPKRLELTRQGQAPVTAPAP